MTTDAYPWSAGFRSLDEEHDYRIEEIDGQVPAWLRGTLFRNGSGRNELGGQWFPHWFDGDGMIAASASTTTASISATATSPPTTTATRPQAGRIMHRGFGKMRPGGILANAFRLPANVSNTSVVMDGDRLLSLWEGGAAVRRRSGDPRNARPRGIRRHDRKPSPPIPSAIPRPASCSTSASTTAPGAR